MQKDLKLRGVSRKARLAQVEEQFKYWQAEGVESERKPRQPATKFITISREYGCAGFRIADRLAGELNGQPSGGEPPWTVYDRKLVDTVCRDYKLSHALVNTVDLQRKFAFGDYITGMFTGEPSTLQVFKNLAETIFRLAAVGRVILIGRGSGLITARLAGGLHLRVVAPLDWRVQQVMAFERFDDLKKCRRHVVHNDRERGRFVRDFVAEDLKLPQHYDLVLNQEKLGVEGITGVVLRLIEMRSMQPQPEMERSLS